MNLIPYADQEVVDYGKNIFALVRHNKEVNEKVMLLVNVTNEEQVAGEYTLSAYEYKWIKL